MKLSHSNTTFIGKGEEGEAIYAQMRKSWQVITRALTAKFQPRLGPRQTCRESNEDPTDTGYNLPHLLEIGTPCLCLTSWAHPGGSSWARQFIRPEM